MSAAVLPAIEQPIEVADRASQRIVILAGFSPSLINFRGPLLRELTGRGHKVVACGPATEPWLPEALKEIGVAFHEVPCDRTGFSVRRDLELLLTLVALFRAIRPDIVLSYTIKPVIYGSLAGRIAGVPAVYSMITGLGYAFSGERLGRRILRAVATQLLRLSLRGNRAVFFQNPDDRAVFNDLGLLRSPEQAVLINGSGVDLSRFLPTPFPEGISFLMIARLLVDKGAREYAEAARLVRARHPEVRFRLVGPFDPNPAALRKEEVQAWVREGLLEYLGELDDVRPAIAQSSVYVLPSYYREGTPRTVLEAMAMGRPAVTTDAPGCRETVQDGVNGYLVRPRDGPSLARALERFIENPALIERMGRQSRWIAVERYDVHKVNRVILQAMSLTP